MSASSKLKEYEDLSRVDLLPIKVKLNITTLDMILAFLYKKSVLKTRKLYVNWEKLFFAIDPKMYESKPELNARVWIIKTSLKARLRDGWEEEDRVLQACRDDEACDEFHEAIIDEIPNLSISHEESKKLIKKLDDTLQFGYIMVFKELYQEILNSIDENDFKSYKAVQEDLYRISASLINIKRTATSLGSDYTFSLVQDQFENVICDCLNILKDRNRIFLTGIQRLNNILAPGYTSKRLYLYLAFPGKGKSTILLKSAIDIKKYNPDIKTKDPDKRPAVLMLTLENDIPETVERLYNMTVSSDDVRNYSYKQVVRQLRTEGCLAITDSNNIDIIIKEYKNREIDTNDIYGIINDLADQGIEVITLIVDYIKRIRPFEKAPDEKGELKNISNELKEIAKFYDISVITAQQLNRSGAAVVDAAIQAKKEDVTRLVGRDSIASAWELNLPRVPHMVTYVKTTSLIAGTTCKVISTKV
jgi:hypothetical protein